MVFFVGLIAYGIVLNLREVTLAEAMKEKGISRIENVSLVVDRSHYRISLYSDTTLVKTYKAVFGKNNAKIKTSFDDGATPIGDYKICSFDTNSIYHKFLRINFPDERDAAEALKNGYIDKEEYDRIYASLENTGCPPVEKKQGTNIGIHGIGKFDIIFRNLPFAFNWTNGSIAVSNENIDELYAVTRIGTPVKIKY